MSTSTLPAGSRLHRLRGARAHGLGGYVLAVLASAMAFGLVLGAAAVIEERGTLAFAPEDLLYVVLLPLGVAAFALVYGWPAAVVGCLLVHLVCLRITSQWMHVLAAGLTGALAGWGYHVLVFDWTFEWLWLELGVATAVGRAAVIPLARRRRS